MFLFIFVAVSLDTDVIKNLNTEDKLPYLIRSLEWTWNELLEINEENFVCFSFFLRKYFLNIYRNFLYFPDLQSQIIRQGNLCTCVVFGIILLHLLTKTNYCCYCATFCSVSLQTKTYKHKYNFLYNVR